MRRLAGIAIALVCAIGPAAAAQLSLLSSFRVDSSTTSKGGSGCASNESGDILVAWIDSPLYDDTLKVRLFESGGLPLSDEVVVDTDVGIYEYPPAVSSSGGSYLVAWSSRFDGVFGRGVAPDISFATESFQLSENLISWFGYATSDVLNGDYLVQWMGGVDTAGGQGAVSRQFSGENFLPLGEEVILSSRPPPPIPHANGLAATSEGFAAVWESYHTIDEVAFQLFSSDGIPVSDSRLLSDDVNGYSRRPTISWGNEGGLAVWSTRVWDPDLGSSVERIQVRPISNLGVPSGPTSTLDTDPTATGWPAITSDGKGGFFVVWGRGDGHFRDVVVQHLDPIGRPLSPITVVNENPELDQHLASVCLLEPGRALVVWNTYISFRNEYIEGRVIDARSSIEVPAVGSVGLVIVIISIAIAATLALHRQSRSMPNKALHADAKPASRSSRR